MVDLAASEQRLKTIVFVGIVESEGLDFVSELSVLAATRADVLVVHMLRSLSMSSGGVAMERLPVVVLVIPRPSLALLGRASCFVADRAEIIVLMLRHL